MRTKTFCLLAFFVCACKGNDVFNTNITSDLNHERTHATGCSFNDDRITFRRACMGKHQISSKPLNEECSAFCEADLVSNRVNEIFVYYRILRIAAYSTKTQNAVTLF